MQAVENKPPYVKFEVRAVEDRDATIEAGHYVAQDLIYALITPQGSRDQIEKSAETWLQDITQAASEDRFPMSWVEAYKSAYKAFQEGREIPVDGTPVLTWPALSPAELKAVLGANIRTVEDLAIANEEAIRYIGMGGVALKERAGSWLASAKDTGKMAEENAALRKQVKDLTKTAEGQAETLAKMTTRMEALEKANA